MAKLFFRHGTMNSGKTGQLLMAADNYTRKGDGVLLFKPDLDTRWGGKAEIKSRAMDTPLPCVIIEPHINLYTFTNEWQQDHPVSAVFVDEAQFLSKEHVRQLVEIVNILNIPVMAYGLRSSYVEGELFEGSKELLYWANEIEEIKTVCAFCNRRSTHNLKLTDGKPSKTGDTISIEGSEENSVYYAACTNHYINPPKLK